MSYKEVKIQAKDRPSWKLHHQQEQRFLMQMKKVPPILTFWYRYTSHFVYQNCFLFKPTYLLTPLAQRRKVGLGFRHHHHLDQALSLTSIRLEVCFWLKRILQMSKDRYNCSWTKSWIRASSNSSITVSCGIILLTTRRNVQQLRENNKNSENERGKVIFD